MDANNSSVQADKVVGIVSLAMLTQISTQYLFTQPAQIGSEMVAWTTLPILFKGFRHQRLIYSIKRNPSLLEYGSLPSIHLWVIAVAICITSWFKREIGVLTSFPMLFPLLLVSAKVFNFRTDSSIGLNSCSILTEAFYGSSAVSLLGTFTLGSTNLVEWGLSIIPMSCILGIFVFLSCQHGRSLPHYINTELTSFHLSARVLLILATTVVVEMVIFGLSWGHPFTMLALSRNYMYVLTEVQIRYSSWSTAILVETFSLLSANSPFDESSDLNALLNVFTSLLVLAQIIHVIPSNSKGKSILWLFGLATMAPYLANVWTIYAADNAVVQNRPIAHLMEKAKLEFHDTLQKQSGTYIAACEEYQRRYKIEPPPGFEQWYRFATAHQSPIIDDFDAIYSSIRPLLNLSGREIIENLNNARNLPRNELWSCTFFGGLRKTKCSHNNRVFDRHIQDSFNALLESIPATLPDITFLVNHLDEPRVIFPSLSGAHNSLDIEDQSRQPTWHTVTDACAYRIGKAQASELKSAKRPELPFVIDPVLDQDLCLHPEYSTMHGLFLSPTSFRPIKGLVPVLSTGSPSTMGDILYPSPAYMEPEFEYNASKDIGWEKKQNKLYWAGFTTGAFAVSDDWRQSQRQRFVSLAQNLERRRFPYLYQGRDGSANVWKSMFLNSRLFDVTFTRIFQCEARYCRDQRHYFRTHSWADKDRGLQSRLVFDLDGNGISGRFYSLLASKSAPLKQTLLREWHDDRLKPWVHYIPVSQSMEELPEMVRYFASSNGQERAREIAENGHEWFSRSFRPVDLTIYLYRLLLEIARLLLTCRNSL
ncbi:hypothetical protein BDV25DRAFT_130980 [Aspergillus avenaceus]|uniref:Glycosyl transferase CAP10 domain-containing protein n=1 Tax=Aspergillus avenaceus TaxID=36643 RepID=A0A5N6TR09_ASPAV|nr:hypothetical protein BDV25DRAFT_130980 [Aspergillus avenaceus]